MKAEMLHRDIGFVSNSERTSNTMLHSSFIITEMASSLLSVMTITSRDDPFGGEFIVC